MPPPAKRQRKGKDKPRIKLGSVKPIKEAKFDDEARACVLLLSCRDAPAQHACSDFLTGFSKRKAARKLAGRQKAEAKEKEELLRMRREVRAGR
jgi:hypothetical protein